MATLENREHTVNYAGATNRQDNKWVVDVLSDDGLKLAGAKGVTPYGRAQLGIGTRILMWAMRIYVLLSLILIVAQIYISLHVH